MNNIELNCGEEVVMDYLEFDYDNPIIFDVGANHGAFALACKRKWPHAEIVCFEANPNCAQTLEKNVGSFATIKQVALSNTNREVELYLDGDEDMTASLYQRDLSYQDQVHGTRSISIYTNKLSDYMYNVDRIDYLKIDVEGHELQVLKGAEHFLHPYVIQNIQFEYNSCALDSRTFFKDYWDLLHPLGYEICIAPELMTPIEKYHPTLEDFNSHREILATAK